jgi:type VI secretion system protein VasG
VLSNWFKPALLVRTTIVPYKILNRDALKQTALIKINKLEGYLYSNNNVELFCDDNVVDAIADRCKDVETDARNIDMIMKSNMMPKLSEILLQNYCEDSITKIIVSVDSDNNFIYTAQ